MSEPTQSSSTLTCVKGANQAAARRLLARLEKAYKKPIDLKINANTSILLSLKYPRNKGNVRFSVHHMFLEAPENVLQALESYLVSPTDESQAVLREYMDSESGRKLLGKSERVIKLRSRGTVYDLHKLADAVNDEFFDGKISVRITWSKGALEPRAGRRRHIIFGSYDSQLGLIRIHPALDSERVPEFFVKFVIFHEMLHAVLDTKPQPGGRRCVHTPQFRDREKRHPDYKRAMEWERAFMRNEI